MPPTSVAVKILWFITGLEVSRGSQQRLVHRQTFELAVVEEAVEELSIDGGKVRLRTPKGQICRWQDYKAVNLHGPYSCRDTFTFITLQLLKGVPTGVIANWCDTSVQMIERHYLDKLKVSQLRPVD